MARKFTQNEYITSVISWDAKLVLQCYSDDFLPWCLYVSYHQWRSSSDSKLESQLHFSGFHDLELWASDVEGTIASEGVAQSNVQSYLTI